MINDLNSLASNLWSVDWQSDDLPTKPGISNCNDVHAVAVVLRVHHCLTRGQIPSHIHLLQSALRAEDGEEEDVGALEHLRRTPRIKAEGSNERKSRRFSTGVTPGKPNQGMNKHTSAPALQDIVDQKAANDYQQRKARLDAWVHNISVSVYGNLLPAWMWIDT